MLQEGSNVINDIINVSKLAISIVFVDDTYMFFSDYNL